MKHKIIGEPRQRSTKEQRPPLRPNNAQLPVAQRHNMMTSRFPADATRLARACSGRVNAAGSSSQPRDVAAVAGRTGAS